MPSHVIRLAPKKSHHMLERRPRYDVLLNGTRVGELYYNMTGYVGGLPTVQGHSMNIGERAISAWRQEVAVLNRHAAINIAMGDSDDRRIRLIRPTSDNRSIFAVSQDERGENPLMHLLSRREYMQAVTIFGRADPGIGFFDEDSFAAPGDDKPMILLEPGDEWMLGAIPQGKARIMDAVEAETHLRYIDARYETDDPEVRIVVGRRVMDHSDPEPYFVTRQSLQFGEHIFKDKLRIGDLVAAENTSVSDPGVRTALLADFPWLNLNGEHPIGRQMRQFERAQDAISAGRALPERRGRALDTAQAHDVEQSKLIGPEF